MKTVTIQISDERAAAVLAAFGGSKEAVLQFIRDGLSAKVQQHQQQLEDAKTVQVPKPDFSDLTGDIA